MLQVKVTWVGRFIFGVCYWKSQKIRANNHYGAMLLLAVIEVMYDEGEMVVQL